MSDRSASRGPAWRDDRVWQAGFLIGSALGAAATVVGRHAERSARRGLVDWPAVERIAIARLASAPGTLPAASCAPIEPAYAEAMARSCRRSRRPRDRAAGRRRTIGRRRSGRLGPAQHRDLRLAHRQARGGAARPGRPARRRPRQGDHGDREPLGHHPPARLPPGVHGVARPRPVRPRAALRRADARTVAVRRGEHPGDRSEPAGAARPVPDVDRPARDDPRVRVRGPPLVAAVPELTARAPADAVQTAMPGASVARPCAVSGGRCAARPTAEHWMERLMGDEQRRLFRETQAVMSLLEGFSDYVMDEVGKDLVPGRGADQRAVPRATATGARPSSARCSADRHGPQARAVQEGRALRPRHRRRAWPCRPDSALGRAGDAATRRARSRRPSAGSHA